MPSLPDSFVEVAPDSTGKRIRNVTLQLVQPDSTQPSGYSIVTVYTQVVAIQDEFGNPVFLPGDEWQRDILRELKRIRRAVSLLASSEVEVGRLAALTESVGTALGGSGFDPDEQDATDLSDDDLETGVVTQIDETEDETS